MSDDFGGVSAAEASAAIQGLGKAMNDMLPTVADFEADPDRYIAEWTLGVMRAYVKARVDGFGRT